MVRFCLSISWTGGHLSKQTYLIINNILILIMGSIVYSVLSSHRFAKQPSYDNSNVSWLIPLLHSNNGFSRVWCITKFVLLYFSKPILTRPHINDNNNNISLLMPVLHNNNGFWNVWCITELDLLYFLYLNRQHNNDNNISLLIPVLHNNNGFWNKSCITELDLLYFLYLNRQHNNDNNISLLIPVLHNNNGFCSVCGHGLAIIKSVCAKPAWARTAVIPCCDTLLWYPAVIPCCDIITVAHLKVRVICQHRCSVTTAFPEQDVAPW